MIKSKLIISRIKSGFTLVELLISMSILAILFLLVVNVLSEVQRAWSLAGGKVSQFREARRAFDVMKHNIQQATLNTYERMRFPNPSDPLSPAFDGTTGSDIDANLNPLGYVRYSELQFRTGPTPSLLSGVSGVSPITHPGHGIFFQAPLGYSSQYKHLPTAINGRGYYVEYGDDTLHRPPYLATLLPSKYRYRLMEYAPPSENNTVYDTTATEAGAWMKATSQWSRPVADNIVLLIVSPKKLDQESTNPRDIAPAYIYDSSGNPVTSADSFMQNESDYQLPPAVELVMVVIDERSAENLSLVSGSVPPFTFTDFTTASETQFRSDLAALETYLVGQKVSFRIFSSTIPLRNSRWDS